MQNISPFWTLTHTGDTIMSNKNPFEIRSDMLALAKDYMDQQYQMNVSFAEKALEAGKKSIEEVQDMYKMYSMEDLMEKAKEMYSFVSKKD
jgi:ABC-type transporter lipoprotein component MlaA